MKSPETHYLEAMQELQGSHSPEQHEGVFTETIQLAQEEAGNEYAIICHFKEKLQAAEQIRDEHIRLSAERLARIRELEAEDKKARNDDGLLDEVGYLHMRLLDEANGADKFRKALEWIHNQQLKTLLGTCCANQTCVPYFEDGDEISDCAYRYGVHVGFSTCAGVADEALAR